MDLSNFSKADVEKLTHFLNFVANKAKFELSVKEVIEFFKLLHWAQNDLHKKLEGSIAEVVSVKQVQPEEPKKKAGKK